MLYATLAPDFGIVGCAVDGQACGPDVDLYAPVVLPTGPIALGRVHLPAGTRRLTFEVTTNGTRFTDEVIAFLNEHQISIGVSFDGPPEVQDVSRPALAGSSYDKATPGIRRLMELPDDTVVWPGHDYGPTRSSTLGWEKRNNVNAIEYGYFVQD